MTMNRKPIARRLATACALSLTAMTASAQLFLSTLSFNALGCASGPLSTALVYQDVKKDSAIAAVDNTTTTQLNGAYHFGLAKAYLQYGTVENDTTGNDYDIVGAGVHEPLGAGAAVAQYGQIDAKNTAERKTFTAGYILALS